MWERAARAVSADDEDDVPVRSGRVELGDLVAAPDARRLQLTPLSRAAVAELVGGLDDGHGLDPVIVHARTAGNAFFVSQILAQPDSPLPESVRDAVIARTAALSPPDRRALELLSCAPDGVSDELLTALAVPATTVETLEATGLLDRRGGGVYCSGSSRVSPPGRSARVAVESGSGRSESQRGSAPSTRNPISCRTSRATSGGVAHGQLFGRLDRSFSPAGPSLFQRSSHS